MQKRKCSKRKKSQTNKSRDRQAETASLWLLLKNTKVNMANGRQQHRLLNVLWLHFLSFFSFYIHFTCVLSHEGIDSEVNWMLFQINSLCVCACNKKRTVWASWSLWMSIYNNVVFDAAQVNFSICHTRSPTTFYLSMDLVFMRISNALQHFIYSWICITY